MSLWVYAYSEGIGSAREIERLMSWEPGLQWLGGLETVNAHTLSDFRVEHREALEGLFAELLAVLEGQGLVDLEQVMHDGTKIRAQAGADTFRREKTLRERVEQARQVVQQMGDAWGEDARDRRQAAQQRAARERLQRMESALKVAHALQAEKKTAEEKAAVRVSVTEPEARIMKQGDSGLAPSYNAQISTDAARKVIVGASDAMQQRRGKPDAGHRADRGEPGEEAEAGGSGRRLHESGDDQPVRGRSHRSGRVAAQRRRTKRGGGEGARDRSGVCAAALPDRGRRAESGVSRGMPAGVCAAEP